MELSKYPALSELFEKNVRQKYIEHNCDPSLGITLVEEFLDKTPYYPEALVFKARMLIAINQDEEALDVVKAAKRIDVWKVNYAFDEAEILFKWGRKSEAVHIIGHAIEALLREAVEGVENFLICIDVMDQEKDEVFGLIREEMLNFLSKKSNTLNLDKILPILQSHVTLEEQDNDDEED